MLMNSGEVDLRCQPLLILYNVYIKTEGRNNDIEYVLNIVK